MSTVWNHASRAIVLIVVLATSVGFFAKTKGVYGQDQDKAQVDKGAKQDADQPQDAKGARAKPTMSLWELILGKRVISWLILFISVGTSALFVDLLFTLRSSRFIPPGVANDLNAAISEERFADAEQICKLRPSYLCYVVMCGLRKLHKGVDASEKAMEEASQEQAARVFRKIEYLSVVGNIAPMLGLLGTVFGILLAFKAVAETGGTAVASDLAEGVYMGLVTIVEGLIVAVPALCAYSYFRTRLEQLSSEGNVIAEQIFSNYEIATLSRQSAKARRN